jgi:hypothetical protein
VTLLDSFDGEPRGIHPTASRGRRGDRGETTTGAADAGDAGICWAGDGLRGIAKSSV